MSTTAALPVVAEVEQWLSRFDETLARGDSAGAVELFGQESYWRDLVAFTWNITTVEGQAGVRRMLEHTLSRTQPHRWQVTEEPVAVNGVSEAWIEFETAVGRGRGYLRLRDGKAWTLLTTLEELRGHEESAGLHRPKGVEHGAIAERRTWFEERGREREELGYTTQPYVVIVGGGQGGIALGARLRALQVPTIIVERNARPGDSWRNPVQVALPARSGLVRPSAVHQVPPKLAGVLAKGQDRRLARDVHARAGAELLERH